MKSFFKIILGSCLGVILSFVVIFFILMGAASSISPSSSKMDKEIKSNSILSLKLEGEITDRTYEASFMNFSPFGSNAASSIGLFDIEKVLNKAKNDDNIKILALDIDKLSMGIASTYQFIQMLEDFKKSNKPVYLYSNGATQKTILIGAYADKIYLNPVANCEFDGFVLENMFYTGLLEKVGVQPRIFYAGEFKSATEPFRLKANSPENKLQLTELLQDVSTKYYTSLAQKLKQNPDSIIAYANQLKITQAADAKKYGLVSDLKYEDEFFDELKTKLGYKKDDKINYVSYKTYKESIIPEKNSRDAQNQIAVLFAEGEIVDGKGEQGIIASENFLNEIRGIQAKVKAKKVKALVLRVNSPGGSAYASEQIWRELSLLKKEIPIVVSFGDVAASGGYYISCASNKIFAQDNTITGSIGVFGILFNMQNLLNNKLGITTDAVKTSPYADYGNSTRNWDETENKAMQRDIDFIYTLFKKRVAEARNLTEEEVSEIAKGRIYSGEDAKSIGLVDEIGTLKDAIAEAKKLAKINEPKVVYYPEDKKGFDLFLNSILGEESAKTKIFSLFQSEQKMYKEILQLKEYQQPQTRMPLIFKIY